jgi:hypothetical protein
VPFLLRKITKSRWFREAALAWLPPEELSADAITDLKTADNSLSFWLVNDDRSNLEDMILAVAAAGDFVSHVDYVLIELSSEIEGQFKVEAEPGETAYTSALPFHRDMCELSATKLLRVAAVVSRTPRERWQKGDVEKLLCASYKDGRLDHGKLRERMRKELDSLTRQLSRA